MRRDAGSINPGSVTAASAAFAVINALKVIIAPLTIPRYLPVITVSGNLLALALFVFIWSISSGSGNSKKLIFLSVILSFSTLVYLLFEALYIFPDYYSPNRLLSYSYLCSISLALSSVGFAAFTFRVVLSGIHLSIAAGYFIVLSELKFQRVDLLLIPILLLTLVFIYTILHLLRILYQNLHSERRLQKDLSAAREKIVNQEKMATLATFAAGTAHEINNPITHMFGNIEYLEQHIITLLKNVPRAGTEEQSCMETAADEIFGILEDYKTGFSRVTDIVHNMKQVFRQKSNTTDRIDLSAVVYSSIDYFKKEVSSSIQFVVTLKGPLFLNCSAGDFLTVFQTILSNSIEALDGTGGRISIGGETEGDVIVFTIEDDGMGMGEEVQKEIFKPFFSTKRSKDHMGIGLALCKSIIEQYGGSVGVESREGEYSRFTIHIPLGGEE